MTDDERDTVLPHPLKRTRSVSHPDLCCIGPLLMPRFEGGSLHSAQKRRGKFWKRMSFYILRVPFPLKFITLHFMLHLHHKISQFTLDPLCCKGSAKEQ